MPKFSIVIPTRSRPDTLACTLRTALDQTYTDLEIIVHESGTDSRTEALFAEIGDSRVRYIGTPNHLHMSENWERALGHATGEYVTLLGDDDGLLPTACADAAGIFAAHPAEAITWTKPSYYWPQAPDVPRRNRLQGLVTDTSAVEVKSSRETLEIVYQFRAWYTKMPMIYSSFIRNSLIERVRSAHGRYFANEAPDIASGVANLLYSDDFLCCMRPLSIAGRSHHSTGYQYVFGDPRLRVSVEENIFDHLAIHSTMVRSFNFPLLIANYLLGIREKLCRNNGPDVNYRNMLAEALKWNANVPPGSDSTLPDILEVALKNGISLADLPAPSVAAHSQRPATGIAAYAGSLQFDMDCASIGVHEIAGATRLMEALLPFRDGERTFVSTFLVNSVNLEQHPALELSFSKTGNGIGCLDFGWGEPEPWGVWTIGDAAEITLRIGGNVQSASIRISGTMFVHAVAPEHSELPALAVSCDGVRYPVEATCENLEVDTELRVALRGEGSTVLLRFEVFHARSPLELRISNDSRRLGFGLRRIVLTRLPS